MSDQLHSRRFILLLFARNLLVGGIFVIIVLGGGVWGYHAFENLSWLDSFLNASMILSGMGPVSTLHTTGGKIFAGCYALFSGLTFIAMVALIFSPILHYFFRKIHLQVEN